MYNVSDAYKQEMKMRSRARTTISGTITIIDGTQTIHYPFTNTDMLEKSLVIDNSCENGYDFAPGAVYVGKCAITIKRHGQNYNIDDETLKNKLYDASLNINMYQYLTSGGSQYIPLGTWVIKNIKKIGSDFVAIEAYDIMTKTDKKFDYFEQRVGEPEWTGSPYSALQLVSSNCGIPLAQSMNEIYELTPKDSDGITIAITIDNNMAIPTWRQFLSSIVIMLGGFGFIDRNGRLRVRRLADNLIEENLYYYSPGFPSIDESMLKGIALNEHPVAYNRARMTPYNSKFGPTESGYGPPDDSIPKTLDFGEQKFLYDHEYTQIYGPVYDILSFHLNRLATRVHFLMSTPGEVTYILGDPSYDLGDMIKLTGENLDEHFIITSYTWSYHNGHKLKCVGTDDASTSGSNEVERLNNTSKMQSEVRNVVPVPEDIARVYSGPLPASNYIKIGETSPIQHGIGKFTGFFQLFGFTTEQPGRVSTTITIRVTYGSEFVRYYEHDFRVGNDSVMLAFKGDINELNDFPVTVEAQAYPYSPSEYTLGGFVTQYR